MKPRYNKGKHGMKKNVTCIVILLACAIAVSSCSRAKKQGETAAISKISSDTAGAASREPADTAASKSKKDVMEASVNGTVILSSDVEEAIDNLIIQYQGRIPAAQMNTMRPMLHKQALENLIDQQLLMQEIDRQGITPGKEAVDEQIAEIAGKFPSPAEFNKQLARMGVSEQQLRHDIGQNIKIKTLMKRQMGEVKEVGEEEIAAYYRENTDRFKMPERVKASHILISVSANDSPEERAKKKKMLSGLRKEIEKGADFEQLAREHSSCPSKSKGGDLGYFEKGRMAKPFEDAAFSLKVGEVSDVVETTFGYHLIKVADHQTAGVVPLEEVGDKIGAFLTNQNMEELIKEYLGTLRSTAKIEYPEGSS